MGIQSELSHKIITMIGNGFSTEIFIGIQSANGRTNCHSTDEELYNEHGE